MISLDDFILSGRAAPPLSDAQLLSAIATSVRRQRRAFGLRQEDLALRANVSRQAIKSLERGARVTAATLVRVLVALGHGKDLVSVLESPHYPSIAAHERFVHGTEAKRIRRRIRSIEYAD